MDGDSKRSAARLGRKRLFSCLPGDRERLWTAEKRVGTRVAIEAGMFRGFQLSVGALFLVGGAVACSGGDAGWTAPGDEPVSSVQLAQEQNCGDGYCDDFAGEECSFCPEDCGPCGSGGSGGSTGGSGGSGGSTGGSGGSGGSTGGSGGSGGSTGGSGGSSSGYCGDGSCTGAETSLSCPTDCGSGSGGSSGSTGGNDCGDGYCDDFALEDCGWCPQDCGTCGAGGSGGSGGSSGTSGSGGSTGGNDCGDGYCDDFALEDCGWCPQDCGTCGAGGSGGSGGTGGTGTGGSSGSTGGNDCGDGYCDDFALEDCGWCPQDCGTCGAGGSAGSGSGGSAGSTGGNNCGDGYCDDYALEDCGWCPQDCGTCGGPPATCNNGTCDTGENSTNCPADCNTPPGPAQCNGNCQCDANTPAPVAWGVKLDKKFDLTMPCPVIGGNAGASITVAAEAAANGATCPDFKSYTKAKGSITGSVHLCRDAVSLQAEGEYTSEREYCKNCDVNSCMWKPEQTYCEETTYQGAAKPSASREFKFKKQLQTKVASALPTLHLGIDCGATVGVGGEIAVSHKKTEGSCGSCTTCDSTSGTLGVFAKGTGSCQLSASVLGKSVSFGCQDCVEAEVKVNGGVSGGCGGGACLEATGSIETTVSTGCLSFPIPWYNARYQCQAKAVGTAKASTCGGPTADGDLKVSCFAVTDQNQACTEG